MQLDYNPNNGLYLLTAPRERSAELVRQYGLDFWPGASTHKEGVFSTPHPYAAEPFFDFATPSAKTPALTWIAGQVKASKADVWAGGPWRTPYDKELSPYQSCNVDYVMRRLGQQAGVMIADEPGLGKTVQAITIANEMRAKKVLLCVPANIRFQWQQMWLHWSTEQRDPRQIYCILSSKMGVNEDCEVTIISHSLMAAPGLTEALMKQRYDLCIIDEAHYMKDPAAQRTIAAYGGRLKRGAGVSRLEIPGGLSRLARFVLPMTGTPLPNRPKEAWVHANALCPDSIDFLNHSAFCDRYNPIEVREIVVKDKETGLDLIKRYTDESSGRHAELQARLRAHWMCRHAKRQVEKDIKVPLYDLVRAEKTQAVRAALKAESLLGIDIETLSMEGQYADVMGHIAEARRMMGIALAPQAADYAENLLDQGIEKLVMFYWHYDVGDILQQKLERYGVSRVDGRTSAKLKEVEKARFIRGGNRVFIGNHLTLGTGTDGLQNVSSTCILAETDWVPGNNIQCVDRLDRRGQRHSTLALFMVAPESIAERVLGAALRKAQITHAALDRRVA